MPADGTERARATPTAATVTRALKWYGAGQLVGEIAWYAMVLVLAALLEPRAFGIVAVGMVIVRVASLLTQSGTGGAIIAARNLSRGDALAALRLNAAVGVVLTVAVALAAEPLTRTFAEGGDASVLRVLAVIVLLASVGAVPEALLKKRLDFKRFSLATGTAALVTALCAIAAALLGAGVWALVVRQVLYQALVATFAWVAALPVLRSLDDIATAGPSARRLTGRLPFLMVAASLLVALTLDNLVVGALTDATQLGLYSLAFTLGFAPLTQLSWRIGQVLFPAAAATDHIAAVGRRTVRAVRLSALLLLPLIPVAVTLAPALVPALFGPEWKGAVIPFQVLILVGILHALVNTIGESLSGTGNIGFRARADTVWAVGTLALVVALTAIDGIRGAAFAHLVAFIPLALTYVVWGARLIGSEARAFWGGMRDIVVAVLAQVAVSGALFAVLGAGDSLPAAVVAAAGGLTTLALALALAPSRPLGDARALVSLALPRRGAAKA